MELKEDAKPTGYWWCDTCKEEKAWHHVTHGENCSDCGQRVKWLLLNPVEQMELKRLTDLELASNQGEKDRCLEIIRGFDSCEGCSAQCHLIAQAQLKKDKAQIQPLIEQAKRETAREIFFELEQMWDSTVFHSVYKEDLEALMKKYGIE